MLSYPTGTLVSTKFLQHPGYLRRCLGGSDVPHPALLMRFTISIPYGQQMRYIVATQTLPQIPGVLQALRGRKCNPNELSISKVILATVPQLIDCSHIFIWRDRSQRLFFDHLLHCASLFVPQFYICFLLGYQTFKG
ncbi:hypothetical protein L873DRAFT_1821624 [Choiromyces venosus 120613-1]|uniref:Uncharacterized protein n=1 Tax=Choiromyces venosus 120613-1 TaxID=1336337 RepID=A0A3N4J148_9PEZI|nr:hypothetical protein L873DRAFT_1821624 [Choiromyces venosus 120613-1]